MLAQQRHTTADCDALGAQVDPASVRLDVALPASLPPAKRGAEVSLTSASTAVPPAQVPFRPLPVSCCFSDLDDDVTMIEIAMAFPTIEGHDSQAGRTTCVACRHCRCPTMQKWVCWRCLASCSRWSAHMQCVCHGQHLRREGLRLQLQSEAAPDRSDTPLRWQILFGPKPIAGGGASAAAAASGGC